MHCVRDEAHPGLHMLDTSTFKFNRVTPGSLAPHSTLNAYLHSYCPAINLTRWSRVLRDTAASQLNDSSAGAFARSGSG